MFKNIFETIANIPVHIGVQKLKVVVFYTLLPLFLKWSKGFSLGIEDVQLRSKNWVELIARSPDIDAIADKFFVKGKNNARKFSAGQGIDIYLALPDEKYQDVLDHLNGAEECEMPASGLLVCVSKQLTSWTGR